MTEEITLPGFVLARYGEIEAIARAAADESEASPYGTWQFTVDRDEASDGQVREVAALRLGSEVLSSVGPGHLYFPGEEMATHIACHDPAYVLADIAAKRQLVERCVDDLAHGRDLPEGVRDGRDPDEVELDEEIAAVAKTTLEILALPFAGHQDWREEWRP